MPPFSTLNHATITAGKDAVSSAEISEVPSLLVSCNLMTQQPFVAQVLSRVSMCPIPLTPLTAAVRTVQRAKRELLQRRRRPGGLVFLAGRLLLCPLPPSLFPSKHPPPFTQFQVFSTQLLSFILSTCWVWHSHHASTSPSSTLFLTRVCSPSIPPLLASGPTFSAAAVPQFFYRRHGCRAKRFRFVGVHHHQSMLLAGLHCQHRRVLASIDVMKDH